MRMVGYNKDFAAASGIPVNRSAILAMVLSGALVGFGRRGSDYGLLWKIFRFIFIRLWLGWNDDCLAGTE